MTAYKNLLYDCQGGIALITMNRPEVMNALNIETLRELAAVFSAAEKDEKVKVIVITGAGKAFIAGADLTMHRECTALEGREVAVYGQTIFSRIENLTKPVIAAINGFALGGGCELAMACDIRVASETARFGQPEVNLGIIPGWGGTQRLPRLIGKGRAKYYILTGEIFNAAEAFRIGLVDKVVDAADLLNASKAIAQAIMSKGPVAVTMAKRAINNGLNMDLEAGIAYEAEAYTTSFGSIDRIEGVTAFLEKRKPIFFGK